VVGLVRDLGLQPVAPDDFPEEIDEDDLGVVCWMTVLPAPRCREDVPALSVRKIFETA
jgi:hypothetical protein